MLRFALGNRWRQRLTDERRVDDSAPPKDTWGGGGTGSAKAV
jgi:hypothetical protein